MKKRILTGALTAAVLMTCSSAALADGTRFRGGVGLEGGPLIIADGLTLGYAGVYGELGVQINKMIGVYSKPGFDILFGKAGGVNLSSAFLVDFTLLRGMVSVGAGPDVGVFAALGDTAGAAGVAYGGRLHFGFHAVRNKRRRNRGRRKALTFGADLRILSAAVAAADVGTNSAVADARAALIMPTISIGYSAF